MGIWKWAGTLNSARLDFGGNFGEGAFAEFSKSYGNPIWKNEDSKNAFKADKFLLFTPIFLKNHMKQVHRSTNRMSFSDFWFFFDFAFFRAVFAQKMVIFQKKPLKWPKMALEKSKKLKKSKIWKRRFICVPLNLFCVKF